METSVLPVYICLFYLNTPRIVAQAYITKKHKFMTKTRVGYDTFQKEINSKSIIFLLKKKHLKRLCIEYNKIQYYTHRNVEINLGSRAFSCLTWPPLESPILSPLNTVHLRLGNSPLSHIVMSDCCTCSVPTLFSSVVSEGVQQAACAEAEWLQQPSGGP